MKPLLLIIILFSGCNLTSDHTSHTSVIPSGVGNDTTVIQKTITAANVLLLKNSDSSLKLIQKALAQSKASSFVRGIGEAYVSVGNYYLVIGKTDSSENYYNKALEYPVWNTAERAQIHKRLASSYQAQGAYEKAISYYKGIIALNSKNDSLLTSVKNAAYYNFINILISLKRYPDALFYSQKLIPRIMDKDMWLLANCYNNIAIVYDKLKDYKQYAIYANKCVKICDSNKFNDLEAIIFANMSEHYADRKDTAKALQYLAKVKHLQNDLLPKGGLIYYGTKGTVMMDLGRYQDALSPLEHALEIAQKHQATEIVIDAKNNLAQAYTHTGNYKKATEQYKSYIALKDSFQGQQTQKDISKYEVKFRTAEKDKELLQKQITLLHQQSVIKSKNLLIAEIATGAALLFLLLILLYRMYLQKQRAQKKDLKILKQQAIIGNLQAFVDGENKERTRIGRELHDGINSMLTAINMNLGAIQQRHFSDKKKNELDDVIKMIQSTGSEIRRTAHDLMPKPLQDQSLPEAVALFVNGINNSGTCELHLSCNGDFKNLEMGTATIIYRLIQELIHNTLKHAAATFVMIQINRQKGKISFMVEDNGRGFHPETENKGIGLSQLATRIKAMKGYLKIDSQMGRGTVVLIEINEDAAKQIYSDEHKNIYN